MYNYALCCAQNIYKLNSHQLVFLVVIFVCYIKLIIFCLIVLFNSEHVSTVEASTHDDVADDEDVGRDEMSVQADETVVEEEEEAADDERVGKWL